MQRRTGAGGCQRERASHCSGPIWAVDDDYKCYNVGLCGTAYGSRASIVKLAFPPSPCPNMAALEFSSRAVRKGPCDFCIKAGAYIESARNLLSSVSRLKRIFPPPKVKLCRCVGKGTAEKRTNFAKGRASGHERFRIGLCRKGNESRRATWRDPGFSRLRSGICSRLYAQCVKCTPRCVIRTVAKLPRELVTKHTASENNILF